MALINLLEKYYDPEFQINFHNIEKKLNGEIPVTRLELIELINSWGRIDFFYTQYLDEDVKIEQCKATQSEQALLVRKECYDLSKLDVSKITNMERLFMFSNFNGDISNWNTSNVTDMNEMFYYAKNFNGDISKWDVSKVTNMNLMFSNTEEFNQPLNNWDVSNVINMFHIFGKTQKFNQDISDWNLNDMVYFEDAFYKAEAFLNKYNNGEILPNNSNEIKVWFNKNRERMNMIDFKEKHGNEITNFFSNFNLSKIKDR